METKKAVKRTVLVVDDDIDLLTQLRMQFETIGYTVLTAESEREAEKVLETAKPDVAVLDLMMENMDAGFSLSYHIKKKDASIPVIIVTGVTRETGLEFDITSTEERSWVKADAILDKPIRFEQLLREIERLIK